MPGFSLIGGRSIEKIRRPEVGHVDHGFARESLHQWRGRPGMLRQAPSLHPEGWVAEIDAGLLAEDQRLGHRVVIVSDPEAGEADAASVGMAHPFGRQDGTHFNNHIQILSYLPRPDKRHIQRVKRQSGREVFRVSPVEKINFLNGLALAEQESQQANVLIDPVVPDVGVLSDKKRYADSQAAVFRHF